MRWDIWDGEVRLVTIEEEVEVGQLVVGRVGSSDGGCLD